MALDRRLARDIAPFGAATLLAFALVPIGNRVDWAGYALATSLAIAVACLAVLAPWPRLPRATRLVPSLLYLVAVSLLRDASGIVVGVGALTLLPVVWMALHGSRGQLLAVIAGVCAFFLAPGVLGGGPDYPISIWRIALVFGAASAIVGLAVQNLVTRVRSQAKALAARERELEAVTDLLRSLSMTDELTGLPNRRAWDTRLEQAIGGSEPFCVAFLDLDHFKSYNDDHGHQAGDRLLKEAAAAWRAELRPTDTLARYGGEEFVVLLHERDIEVARGVVDRLRAATPLGESCSAGVARREDGDEPSALLGRADDALYDAKRSGRNRSLIAGFQL